MTASLWRRRLAAPRARRTTGPRVSSQTLASPVPFTQLHMPSTGLRSGAYAGRRFDCEPSRVLFDPVTDCGGAVGLDAIPEEDDTAADMTSEMAEKPQDGRGAHGAWLEQEKHSRPAAVPRVGERPHRGHPAPAALARPEHWGLTPRRPGAANHRPLREARLIHEDQGPVSAGVFFARGQM